MLSVEVGTKLGNGVIDCGPTTLNRQILEEIDISARISRQSLKCRADIFACQNMPSALHVPL